MRFNDVIDNWQNWQRSLPSPYPVQPPSVLEQLVKSSGVYEADEPRPSFDARLAEFTDSTILQLPENMRSAILGRHSYSPVWRRKFVSLGSEWSMYYSSARVSIMAAVDRYEKRKA